MRILVTGGAGFVGSALVRRLMPDHELFCLVRKDGDLPDHPHVHSILQDLAAPLESTRLPATLDAIIHLAQSRQFRKFPEQAQDIFKVNVDSTAQLLDYGRRAKVRTFIFASSGGVCGYQPRPIVETDSPELSNFYLASKYASECLVNAYSDHFTAVILRYFFVYGEGQRGMFMPGLVERVLKGEPVLVSGKAGLMMNPVYVSDAVEAIIRSLDLQSQTTINVAGAEITTILALADLIGQLTGRQPVCQHEPEKGPMKMVANIEKMKLALALVPEVSLREGVSRLVNDLTGKIGK
ncbi:MAG: NAD(P)-dependent oxidoreductase [Nitrospira sp.]|nr:NAD(P)-dependent oxidoreductase [Nitrospira sp.]